MTRDRRWNVREKKRQGRTLDLLVGPWNFLKYVI